MTAKWSAGSKRIPSVSLPLPASDDCVRRLARARALWLESGAQLSVPSNFAAAEAVKNLHDSAEEFLDATYHAAGGGEVGRVREFSGKDSTADRAAA
jgi:hypothetical protein